MSKQQTALLSPEEFEAWLADVDQLLAPVSGKFPIDERGIATARHNAKVAEAAKRVDGSITAWSNVDDLFTALLALHTALATAVEPDV
jgi:hypothetical protein